MLGWGINLERTNIVRGKNARAFMTWWRSRTEQKSGENSKSKKKKHLYLHEGELNPIRMKWSEKQKHLYPHEGELNEGRRKWSGRQKHLWREKPEELLREGKACSNSNSEICQSHGKDAHNSLLYQIRLGIFTCTWLEPTERLRSSGPKSNGNLTPTNMTFDPQTFSL